MFYSLFKQYDINVINWFRIYMLFSFIHGPENWHSKTCHPEKFSIDIYTHLNKLNRINISC